MKAYAPLLLGSLLLGSLSGAQAQFAKPEDAIKYRKSAFFVMQQNFSRVAAMASGKAPFNAQVAAESAAVAEFVGKLPWAGFGPGTETGDTRAKPEIWSQRAKFDDYAQKMQSALGKLNTAASSGKLDAIKVAVNDAGATCKSCHDDFRAK
ncbi:MAG: cytochrome c [Rhodoferax sp.]